MDLTQYVDNLRHELLAAAEVGDEQARELAGRLIVPLESTARLTFLNVLSAAAEEISHEAAPGSVDLRLRGLDPSFVVTLPQLPPSSHDDDEDRYGEPVSGTTLPVPAKADDGATARVNFRLPEQLKARIEEAARREGLSVNAWLVRAVSATLEQGARPAGRRTPQGGQRFSGWAR
ncbi:ribbon-helix-helix protein, CopG family [Streptomyces sp. NPDC101194]|uniref:ribbon-helix-helix protein, CopG family n=1 Tax=Streptomyces sp. NPDC101194 TaxID=3366127 RepID=UPI003800329E